jgi:hypothetical protein
MRVDDLMDHGQTKAGALRRGREERIEDLLRVSGGMPTPSSLMLIATVAPSASTRVSMRTVPVVSIACIALISRFSSAYFSASPRDPWQRSGG